MIHSWGFLAFRSPWEPTDALRCTPSPFLSLLPGRQGKGAGVPETLRSWARCLPPLLQRGGLRAGPGLRRLRLQVRRAQWLVVRAGGGAGSPVSRPPAPPRPGSYKPGRRPSRRFTRSMAWNTNLRWRLPLTCLLLQVAMVVLFGVFMRYDTDADVSWWREKAHRNITTDLENEFYYRYPSKSALTWATAVLPIWLAVA